MSSKPLSDKRLVIELSIMLVLKLILLFVIWCQFFSSPPGLDNTQATTERLLPSSSQGDKP